MDSIIGVLAFVTIGGIFGFAIFEFGFAADRESSATGASAERVDGRSLRQRLDEAPGLNDRLSNRALGPNPWDALLDTKWSDLRSVLKGDSLK